ncbi:MAG: hypothetical protein PHN42_01795 [Bacilli bacterium]|nr:hypothetical protein [Bacilli bacterium]
MEKVNINTIMAIKKKQINTSNSNKINSLPTSYVYELKDNTIVKIFDKKLLSIAKAYDADIEKKVLSQDKIVFNDNIILPDKLVYNDENEFVGYTMKKVSGPNYNEYHENLKYRDITDLNKYILVHSKIEEIMEKNENIVFPDICSCNNIYLNRNLDLYLIDYDGMQIEDFASLNLSTSLGSQDILDNPKYRCGNLCTKELDKRSSIILFFLTVFNLNLSLVGKVLPSTGDIITLEEALYNIGATDYELYDKVKRIFDNNLQNEFLGETLQKLQSDYKLEINQKIYNKDIYFKKLVKR